MSRVCVLAVLAAALLAVPAGSASAAPVDGVEFRACFADTGTSNVCTKVEGLNGANRVVVSPDGRNVYVASVDDGALLTFDRAADGSLTRTGCVRATAASGCTTLATIAGASDIAISPDGTSLYLVARTSDSVTRFTRAAGGALTNAGCFSL